MEQGDGDSPPFLPAISALPRRRHRSPSPFFDQALLIIIVPIVSLLLIFFLIPPFLSLTSQIFRPNHTNNAVKKGWDSLNVFLVLFAIFCGIFAKRNDDASTSSTDADNTASTMEKPNQSVSISKQWLDQYSDLHEKIYDPPAIGGNRLRRSSSSYPDLRQDSLWQTADDRFRFFDDFEVNRYRSPVPENYACRRRPTEEDFNIKVIPVDKFELRSPAPPSPSPSPDPPPPKSPSPAPPPPPPPPRQKPKRATYQSVPRKEKILERMNSENVKTRPRSSPPPTPPPPTPPPPPPGPMLQRSEQDFVRIERKKSNTTKELKTVLASIYNQRKRKKKHKKNRIDDSLHSSTSSLHSGVGLPPSRPPPPPPPPPPSVFYNLFKKGNKSKKVHSVSPTPPPPPPPLPIRSSNRQSVPPPPSQPSKPPLPESSRIRSSVVGGRPPLPTKINNFYDRDDKVNSGGQSPLIPMPPPPPQPPFRIPDTKFAVRGDYVKIQNTHSSRCSSPELEEAELPSKRNSSDKMDGGDGIGSSVFCPSPDVNIKADTFIAKLRGEWKLEKMNSMKEKQESWAKAKAKA